MNIIAMAGWFKAIPRKTHPTLEDSDVDPEDEVRISEPALVGGILKALSNLQHLNLSTVLERGVQAVAV